MESLKELYRIGKGPSSSHTMGPDFAAKLFKKENPDADHFIVTLYGSLSKTGKGHMTDTAIINALAPKKCEVIFNQESSKHFRHENTMHFQAMDDHNAIIADARIFSVGGGKIEIQGRKPLQAEDVYELNSFSEIKAYCREKHIRICDYVYETEGPEVKIFLADVWNHMKAAIGNGLETEGVLQGGLDVQRKARFLYQQHHIDESPVTKENRLVCSYAYAVSEENAGGGIIVTAPTCGACGVVPAALFYTQQKHGLSDEQMVDALATAGIIGDLIKTNASISGAECGCQAEVGSACCMAAAGLAEVFGMDLDQIEYAAEVAMEHHLGLTCDPINGLVQIPCIERNAVAAMRAINAISLANFLTYTRKISFDMVIQTMYETGKSMSVKFRETSEGGLAKVYHE